MKEILDNYIECAFGEYEQAYFKILQFENNYKKYFPIEKSAKLLDIGIGRGEMLSCMKKWGYDDYLGIDISRSTIKFCKSLELKCVLIEDTVEWFQDIESEFDIITILDVLEHFEKKEVIPFIKAAFRAIKVDGNIIIQVPNMQAPDSMLHMYNDFTHNIGFVEHSLRQLLISVGINKMIICGFEEMLGKGMKIQIRKAIRSIYWKKCKLFRKINTNLCPEIMNPVFYVVITK